MTNKPSIEEKIQKVWKEQFGETHSDQRLKVMVVYDKIIDDIHLSTRPEVIEKIEKKYIRRLNAYADFESAVMDGVEPEIAQVKLLQSIKKIK